MMRARIYWLIFSSLSYHYLGCQERKVIVTESEIAYFQSQFDSLRLLVTNNKAIQNYQICALESHHEFSIPSHFILMPRYALKLPKKKKRNFARTYVLISKGTVCYDKKDYLGSDLYWQQALEIANKEGFDYEELHSLRPALNNNCFLSGNFSGAMRISTEGLILAEKIGDLKRSAHFNNVIGCVHLKQGNYMESDRYFRREFELGRQVNDTQIVAHALYNLADLAIARNQYDSSLMYSQLSIETYRSIPDRSDKGFSLPEREAFIFNKMSEAAKFKGDLAIALTFARLADSVASKAVGVNEYDRASYKINLGGIYTLLGKNDSALLTLNKGLAIANAISHREHKRDAYKSIAKVFALQQSFDSAYSYQRRSEQEQDSISGESSQLEIFQQETALQIAQERQRQQSALDRQRLLKNIMAGIAALLVIIVYLLYNRYRLRQKTRYQKELNRQQNELFNAIAAAQDQERKRIAQDIHDSLGAILSAAKLRLSALKESETALTKEQDENYQTTFQLLDEASSELRNISHNIMPATLSKLGLVAALNNLSNTISSHAGLQVAFNAHAFDVRIKEDTEMSIYRIVLELLNNTVKHSGADKVTIQIIKHPGYINLSVEDNGKGFDYTEALEAKKGIGLGNILSRVKYLEGTMDVDTIKGRGTMVVIDIPYNTRA